MIKTEAKPRNIKKTKSLKKFESQNPVSILENNEEEEEDIKRLEIVKMKKMLLKRCRNCHFKKRSCMVDRSSCSALQKKCFACKQRGHFPKSLNCKKSRKNKRSKIPVINSEKKSDECKKQISETELILIKERICQIEQYSQQQTSSLCTKVPIQQTRFKEMIPFVMMYIFLNFDCIWPTKSCRSTSNLLELEKKEIDLKKSILKLAKECANKFDKMDYLQDKQYFSNYCSRKLRQCFHIEPRSNADEKASAKNILDAFDKMFYIGKEANTPTQMRGDDNEFDNACDESDFAECEQKETKHSTYTV